MCPAGTHTQAEKVYCWPTIMPTMESQVTDWLSTPAHVTSIEPVPRCARTVDRATDGLPEDAQLATLVSKSPLARWFRGRAAAPSHTCTASTQHWVPTVGVPTCWSASRCCVAVAVNVRLMRCQVSVRVDAAPTATPSTRHSMAGAPAATHT